MAGGVGTAWRGAAQAAWTTGGALGSGPRVASARPDPPPDPGRPTPTPRLGTRPKDKRGSGAPRSCVHGYISIHTLRNIRSEIGYRSSAGVRSAGRAVVRIRASPLSSRFALKILMPSPRSRIRRGNFPAPKTISTTTRTTSQCIKLKAPNSSSFW